MPWVSKIQRAWAHATGQPWAAKWDRHTPKGKKLPARKGRSRRGRAR
jgi:hypothetical protein